MENVGASGSESCLLIRSSRVDHVWQDVRCLLQFRMRDATERGNNRAKDRPRSVRAKACQEGRAVDPKARDSIQMNVSALGKGKSSASKGLRCPRLDCPCRKYAACMCMLLDGFRSADLGGDLRSER